MKKIILLLLLAFNYTLFQCFGQAKVGQPFIDSLLHELPKAKEDTGKVTLLNLISDKYRKINPDEGIKTGKQALILAEKLNWKKGIANSNRLIGVNKFSKADYAGALENWQKSLKLNEELGDKKGISKVLGNIGLVYKNKSDYAKALEYYFKANSIDEELENKDGIAINLGNIGNVYLEQSNYPNALIYYLKALQLFEELKNKDGIARNLGNIGIVYRKQSDYTKALEYYSKALALYLEMGNKNDAGRTLGNMGIIYYMQSNYPKALEYYLKSLKVDQELGNKNGIAANFGRIGDIYHEQKNLPLALEYYLKSKTLDEELGNKSEIAANLSRIGTVYWEIAKGNYKDNNGLGANKSNLLQKAKASIDSAIVLFKEVGDLNNLFSNYKQLSELLTLQEDYIGALSNYKNYTLYKDSVFNIEKDKKITQTAMNFEFDKKEAIAKAEQAKKDAITKQEQIAFIGGLSFMVLLAGMSFRSYRRKRKDNIIITKQKQEVEQKNIEITKSIQYALRIQTAILPPPKIVKLNLENSFVLYKPKDIVAGDFYWMETIDDLVLFAACDCTGHGVPGAMVSVVCYNALNRAVREFGLTKPSKILDKTTEIVKENFSKSEDDIKDGMDISLCAYYPKTKTLQWAGANNPLWLLKNNELIETKANKQPIGKSEGNNPFTNHEYMLNTGDTVYIFSDGFPDQFGGEAGKKFTKKRFRELILSVQSQTIQEQGITLDKFITEYRKEIEQTDDILVMGVKI